MQSLLRIIILLVIIQTFTFDPHVFAASDRVNSRQSEVNDSTIINEISIPLEIFTGMYAKKISLEKNRDRFLAEIYFWFRYSDNIANKELFNIEEDISILEFINGDIDHIIIDEGYIVGDEYYVNGRLKGEFEFYSDYKDYPFDLLDLPITIEHSYLTSDQIVFVPDTISLRRTGISSGFSNHSEEISLSDFYITGSSYRAHTSTYNTDFGDIEASINSEYSRFSFYIHLERNFLSFTFKAFIPLLIVLTLAYLVFFIPAGELELAGGLTATSLLAAIAFQWTINSEMPNVGGLILIDYVFYLAYFLIMTAMVQTVYTFNLENREFNKEAGKILSNRLEIAGRILYPIIFLGVLIYIFIRKGLM